MAAEASLSMGLLMLALAAGQFSSTSSTAQAQPPALLLAQSAAPAEPTPREYQGWIGKRLVRNTEIYSGSEPTVREADLPRPYRIFTPGHSVGDMMYDPGRTNLFLDERSMIVKVSKG